jgi:hypothetical protein
MKAIARTRSPPIDSPVGHDQCTSIAITRPARVKNRLRAKTNFLSRIKLFWVVQPQRKIIRFCFSEICDFLSPSRLDQRGAYRDRHET